MKEYLFDDFFSTLDVAGQAVINEINEYIKLYYTEYKPFDIKPVNKSKKEWRLHFRKKPKVGKAICSAYSNNGKLSIRFCLLSSMTHELLLRQNEFSDKVRNNALKQIFCVVNQSCRNYGGNAICQLRQHYIINNRLIVACPYPWVSINDCGESDIKDIKIFVDLQMKHMVQDSKDIKGALYTKENTERCGNVQIIDIDDINLNSGLPESSNHVKKVERLNKYANLYNLAPIGEKDGLWFYISDDLILGTYDEKIKKSHNKIPKGRYATVVVENPFTFSVNRAWNYICKWVQENKENINVIKLDNNKNTACFLRFFIKDAKEFYELYVSLK